MEFQSRIRNFILLSEYHLYNPKCTLLLQAWRHVLNSFNAVFIVLSYIYDFYIFYRRRQRDVKPILFPT